MYGIVKKILEEKKSELKVSWESWWLLIGQGVAGGRDRLPSSFWVCKWGQGLQMMTPPTHPAEPPLHFH